MMNAIQGFNPLRWDCSNKGCYNTSVRPRIENFAQCFPRKIAMTDIDGMVEIGGNFLMLEWKQTPGSLGRGQEIMFERLTKAGMPFRVYVVTGQSQTMEIEDFAIYENSTVQRFVDVDFNDLLASIKGWADWAEVNRR